MGTDGFMGIDGMSDLLDDCDALHRGRGDDVKKRLERRSS